MLSNLVLSYCSKLKTMWGQIVLECKNKYDMIHVRMVEDFWWVVGPVFVSEGIDDGVGKVCLRGSLCPSKGLE